VVCAIGASSAGCLLWETGAPCERAADCATGFGCVEGWCDPSPLPPLSIAEPAPPAAPEPVDPGDALRPPLIADDCPALAPQHSAAIRLRPSTSWSSGADALPFAVLPLDVRQGAFSLGRCGPLIPSLSPSSIEVQGLHLDPTGEVEKTLTLPFAWAEPFSGEFVRIWLRAVDVEGVVFPFHEAGVALRIVAHAPTPEWESPFVDNGSRITVSFLESLSVNGHDTCQLLYAFNSVGFVDVGRDLVSTCVPGDSLLQRVNSDNFVQSTSLSLLRPPRTGRERTTLSFRFDRAGGDFSIRTDSGPLLLVVKGGTVFLNDEPVGPTNVTDGVGVLTASMRRSGDDVRLTVRVDGHEREDRHRDTDLRWREAIPAIELLRATSEVPFRISTLRVNADARSSDVEAAALEHVFLRERGFTHEGTETLAHPDVPE